MPLAVAVNASEQMTAAGTPARSSAMPSATAEALQEPQSPTPVITTSHSRTNSCSWSSGSGSANAVFVRRSTPATPCSRWRISARSSSSSAALCLVFSSRPSRAPARSARRGASVEEPMRGAVWPVGSRMSASVAMGPSVLSGRWTTVAPFQGPTLSVRRAGRKGVLHSVVDDDAADVLAVVEVLVGLVDLVEPVRARDQLVELQLPGPVQPQQLRDVVERVAVAE